MEQGRYFSGHSWHGASTARLSREFAMKSRSYRIQLFPQREEYSPQRKISIAHIQRPFDTRIIAGPLRARSMNDSSVNRNSPGRDVLIDYAALHNEHNPPDGRDVFQRITIERDDVRLQTHGD